MRFVSLAVLAGVLCTTACAPLPSADAMAAAAPDLAARGRDPGDPSALASLRAGLAGQTLSVDTAIRLAILGNPQLQAEFARLGFAAADVYEAARPRNPALSVSVLSPDEGGAARQIGVGISQRITDLLMLGARKRLAEGEYERVRQMIGARALDVAADTEAAFFEVAAAVQAVTVREAIARAASTSAGLAQRVFDAGNGSRLDLSLEKAAAAESALSLMQARADLVTARARLTRLMGLGAADDGWLAPAALPDIPGADIAVEDLLSLADGKRLDLAAARTDVKLQADALGLTRRFRLLGEVDGGLSTERETDRSRITGPSLTLELPLFDRGAGRMARSRARLQQSEAALAALEVDISSTVREKAALLGSARERAEHYRDVLLPLREDVVSLMQRQLNYGLDEPSRLLFARQQEYAAYGGYLEAVRDYWLARVELSRAVGAALPDSAAGVVSTPEPAAPTAPRGAGHDAMEHADMTHEGMDHQGADRGSMDHTRMDHGGMDHGGMDHGGMDHGGMDHGSMNHGGMDHGAMEHMQPGEGEPR